MRGARNNFASSNCTGGASLPSWCCWSGCRTNTRNKARLTRLCITLSTMLFLTLAGRLDAAVLQSPRAAAQNEKIRRFSFALPAPRPKTNGVVTLGWDNGNPPQTVIVNQTTGAAFDAGTRGNITLGGLAVGPAQTFIATNASGASNPLTLTIPADTNKLEYVETEIRYIWRGRNGTLQFSSNLVNFVDLGPINTGAVLSFTNNNPSAFYRVKL